MNGWKHITAQMHPHLNCPLCPQQPAPSAPVASGEGGEVDEVELFNWLMGNTSQSRQITAQRLLRAFTITPRKKPGPEGI